MASAERAALDRRAGGRPRRRPGCPRIRTGGDDGGWRRFGPLPADTGRSVIRDVVEFRRCGLACRRVAELDVPVERLAGGDAPCRAPRGRPVHTFLVPPRLATASIGKTSWSTRSAPIPTRCRRAVARAAVVAAGRPAGLAGRHRPRRDTQVRARRRCSAPHLPRPIGPRKGGATGPSRLRGLGPTRPRPVQHHRPRPPPPPPRPVTHLAAYTARRTDPSTPDHHSPAGQPAQPRT